MASLTHTDALERATRITVTSYDVALDLTPTGDEFGSITTIRFTGTAPTFVDVRPSRLESAVLNGRDVAAGFDADTGRLIVEPGDGDNELVVAARMAYSHDGEGIHRHVDPADGRTYVYALSFLDAAPRWFACVDQPDVKAPVALDVRCPADWLVAGNGPATELEPGHWQVAPGPPLATYFTTVVAGPYHRVTDEHDGIPVALLARQSLAEYLDRDAADLFDITRHCFDELHRLFGVRYAWPELTHAFVPEFNGGAMENPGCITYRDTMLFRSRATDADREIRAVTIAHEMAHLWFGDLVTMRWWDDLWLNESFAEYLGQRVVGEQAWVSFGIERKSWGYQADRRPSTHPVAGNGARDAAAALADFDGISYAKGASVLRQLAAHLGDADFLGGLRTHIEAHAYGNAEFADLLAAWNATGTDVTSWADAWLRTSGVDTLAVDDTGVVRTGSRPHAIEVAAFDASGSEVGRRPVSVTGDRSPHGLSPAALLLPDAHDETWAKLALPGTMWRTMPQLLPRLDDPLARVAIWNALRLAVADSELDPRQAAEIVRAALPGEPHDAVIAIVGRWATQSLAGAYVADGSGALTALADGTSAAIASAEPGSGRQLALVRLTVAATHDVALLRRWLGDDVPDGVTLDAELRWLVVRRLAELGSLDADELAAEAAADETSQGSVHAAWCRAARPDPDAKAAAWRTLMTDAGCANYELYALAEAFWRPGQDAVTQPYVARYFAELPDAARLRSGWVADRMAQIAYPWTAVAAATVAATDALLESGTLPPGPHRSVVDAGDDLRRALASRTRFATPPR